MSERRITDDELSALKDRNPVDVIAGQWVTLRRKSPRSRLSVGPCPICSLNPQSRGAGRFECDADKWVCAVCQDGGDVIALTMKREGVKFVEAVERLGGVRAEIITPAIAERRGAQDFKRDASSPGCEPPAAYDEPCRAAYVAGWNRADRAARAAQAYRERERLRLMNFWREAARFPGTPVETYLAGRGLIAPANALIRYHSRMTLFASGREVEPVEVHTGPAMLAAIAGPDGRFAGLHSTWLDLNAPKGKACVRDPITGELLPAKKVRGSKSGGYIDLGGTPIAAGARRMIAGEGIETVLAVYTALVRAGRDVSLTVLRAGIDLGNLAGKARETIAHPTLKTPTGRAQRVPNSVPDLSSPAMPVPAEIDELVLLGDGDSDPFLTRNALERARSRHARDGRAVRVRFASSGLDFNDMINRSAMPGEESSEIHNDDR